MALVRRNRRTQERGPSGPSAARRAREHKLHVGQRRFPPLSCILAPEDVGSATSRGLFRLRRTLAEAGRHLRGRRRGDAASKPMIIFALYLLCGVTYGIGERRVAPDAVVTAYRWDRQEAPKRRGERPQCGKGQMAAGRSSDGSTCWCLHGDSLRPHLRFRRPHALAGQNKLSRRHPHERLSVSARASR